MQSITEIQDALIADEINRIVALSKETLVEELIELKSRAIENAPPEEVLKLCRKKKNDD